MARITAKCYLKLGEWQESSSPPQALGSFLLILIIQILNTYLRYFLVLNESVSTPANIQYTSGPQSQRSPMAILQQPTTPPFTHQPVDQSAAKKLHCYTLATNFDQNWYKV
jgi:hypothetical protein